MTRTSTWQGSSRASLPSSALLPAHRPRSCGSPTPSPAGLPIQREPHRAQRRSLVSSPLRRSLPARAFLTTGLLGSGEVTARAGVHPDDAILEQQAAVNRLANFRRRLTAATGAPASKLLALDWRGTSRADSLSGTGPRLSDRQDSQTATASSAELEQLQARQLDGTSPASNRSPRGECPA